MYYLLTLLFGFLGVLALSRTIERLAHGAGVVPAQLLMAVLGLVLAVLCLRKARAASRTEK